LGEGAGKFFLAFGHLRRDLAQNSLALEGGQAARRAESFDGGGNGGFGVRFTALNDAGYEAAVVGGADLDEVAILLPPSTKKPWVATGAIVTSDMLCLPPEKLLSSL
jgi:hypothetical protein